MPTPRHRQPYSAYTAIRDQFQPRARCIRKRCATHRPPALSRSAAVLAQVDQVLADDGGRVPAGAR